MSYINSDFHSKSVQKMLIIMITIFFAVGTSTVGTVSSSKLVTSE